MEYSLFAYTMRVQDTVRVASNRVDNGIRQQVLTYETPFGYRRAAKMIAPQSGGPFAGLLYVHWLAETPDANRTEFEDEALEMARCGALSLLVETQWSDRDWFIKRTHAEDYLNSVRQVVELRLALDLLLSHPDVDAKRIGYVGHDFGAMYGVLLGSIDPRPTCYALLAGAPHFADWFLYYPQLVGEPREAYIRRMADLDPLHHVNGLAPAPLLFQFARQDRFVPEARAQEFFAAAAEPKQAYWYDSDHALAIPEARTERIAWLNAQLHTHPRTKMRVHLQPE